MAAPFTVVVRCADPRLETFLLAEHHRSTLGLAPVRVDLGEAHIANVGGLLPLAGAEVPRLVHDAGLLLRLFGGESGRIVLTAHSSCGGYLDAVEGSDDTVRARQEDDLRSTAHRLRGAIPHAVVDCYYLNLEPECIDAIEA